MTGNTIHTGAPAFTIHSDNHESELIMKQNTNLVIADSAGKIPLIEFKDNNEQMFAIYADGKVEWNDKYKTEEAAKKITEVFQSFSGYLVEQVKKHLVYEEYLRRKQKVLEEIIAQCEENKTDFISVDDLKKMVDCVKIHRTLKGDASE